MHSSNWTPVLKEVKTMPNNAEVQKVGDDSKVEVLVNDKPVVLEGARQTGASVKKAATEQGLRIGGDFVLGVELDDGKTKPVEDDEKIEVRAGERFVAVEKDAKAEVWVNDKQVVLVGAEQTGAGVKKAAVEQNVSIKEDFVLSIELGGGKTTLVGDAEEIVVRTGARFVAIDDDDNS